MVAGLLAWGCLIVAPRAGTIKPHRKHRTDFTVYTAAAGAILDGENPYDAASIRNWPYLYPPAVAIVMIPFACLPPATASALWFLLSLLIWAASGWLVFRTLEGRCPGSASAAAKWAMVFAAIPALNTLARGQVNMLILLAAAIMIHALSRRRDLAAGVALGSAACIKVMPILVAVVLAWMWLRDWRGDRTASLSRRLWAGRVLLGVAAGLVFWLAVLPLAVMGPDRTRAAYASWRQNVGAGYFTADAKGNVFGDIPRINEFSDKNQSWYHLACMAVIGFDRDAYGDRQTVSPTWQRRLRWLLGALFVGQLALACLFAPGQWQQRDRIEFYVAPAAMLVMANAMGKLAWAHTFVVALPLAAVCAAMLRDVAWRDRTRRERIVYVTWIAALAGLVGGYVYQPVLGRANLMLLGVTAMIVVAWWYALRTDAPSADRAG